MLPAGHPEAAMLLDYATGTLGEAFALVVAAHLTFCPFCRRALETLEAVGGLALGEAPAADIAEGALERVLAALDRPSAPPEPAAPPPGFEAMPRPIQAALARMPGAGWRRRGAGIEMIRLELGGGRAALMRLGGGRSIFRHDHAGREATVVLAGGYADDAGRYGVGDVALAGPGRTHRPKADPGGCTCLVAVEGPLRFTGLVGLLQRLGGGR